MDTRTRNAKLAWDVCEGIWDCCQMEMECNVMQCKIRVCWYAALCCSEAHVIKHISRWRLSPVGYEAEELEYHLLIKL